MLVDVHCHLDAAPYHDLAAFCQRSQQAGVAVTVAAGKGVVSNRQILTLRHQAPRQIWAAFGLHPERTDVSQEEVDAILDQVQCCREHVVALGEIGLPYYALREHRMTPEQARQHESWLHTLVQAAVRFDLPVVLHAPHAAAAVALAIVKRYDPPGALFHWHKSDPETTRALCEAGYWLSVTPEVCYRDRDRQLVQAVPLDNLLLESDGPWPYGGEFAGELTTSAFVGRVAAEVARLKGVSLEAIQTITTANAERLFRRRVTWPADDDTAGNREV